MLKAFDCNAIDVLSPFIGAIVDECWGLSETSEITNIFTAYVDGVNCIIWKPLSPEWTEEELCRLESRIISFKELARKILSNYQPSQLGTHKWHALDHICEDLQEMGDMAKLHAGLFASSHQDFKKDYSFSSKRARTVMMEAIKKKNSRKVACDPFKDGTETPPNLNQSRRMVDEKDGAFIFKTGFDITLGAIQNVFQHGRIFTGPLKEVGFESSFKYKLPERLKNDGLCTLSQLLQEYFVPETIGLDQTFHRKL